MDMHWIGMLHDSIGGSKFEVKAKVVINAAGPWGQSFPASRVHFSA